MADQSSNPFVTSLKRLQLPAGMGGAINVGGFMLSADEEGCIEVPPHIAVQLEAHGLTPAAEAKPAKKG